MLGEEEWFLREARRFMRELKGLRALCCWRSVLAVGAERC